MTAESFSESVDQLHRNMVAMKRLARVEDLELLEQLVDDCYPLIYRIDDLHKLTLELLSKATVMIQEASSQRSPQ